MSLVCSNHHADNWFNTCPLKGTVARILSNAERRSVVTMSRLPSGRSYQSRTLPAVLLGRGKGVSANELGRSSLSWSFEITNSPFSATVILAYRAVAYFTPFSNNFNPLWQLR